MNIYALINHADSEFIRDVNGRVIYREQVKTPDNDPRGGWVECVRTDDSSVHQPSHHRSDGSIVYHNDVVRGSPVFSFEGGRAYARFPLTRK
jgi:hypothetical protein